MIKRLSSLLVKSQQVNQLGSLFPAYKLSENVKEKEKQIRENDMLWIAANADDKRCSITEIQKFIKEEPILQQSPIRLMDLGKNYFRHINPRKKKTMLQLLDAYAENLTEKEQEHLQIALSIYFDNTYNGKNIDQLSYEEYDLPEELLWHIYSLMVFDRISSHYARYEYLDHFRIIEYFNNRDKEKVNQVKYVFTSHPTQPNSLSQLIAISRMLQGIEQNDYKYIKYAAKLFIQSNKQRVFNKVSYIEESLIYHSQYLPNMIKAVAQAYELGLQNPEEYCQTPGTWLTFDFDNHPGMEIGIMTYTHGLTIELTIQQYLYYIEEAELEQNEQFQKIIALYQEALTYSKLIRELSDRFRVKKEISVEEFFQQLPICNLNKIEDQLGQVLDQVLSSNERSKDYFIALKLKKLFKIFRLTGVLGQIRLAGEDLTDINKVKPMIRNIFKEVSLLNANGQAADMVIVANFQTQAQYDLVQDLLIQYKVQNVEIVPLLETFSSTNNTESRITMIASSDTRQRDGLILTELRNLREYKRNPEKYIYMGQGITPERGGGPYELIHTKYQALTRAQRKLHIRTIQGHYFTSEFASEDVAFTFLVNGLANINYSDDFEPTYQYMDFLFELDNYVGVPQRAMQKTKEYNDLYVKNQVIRTMVESFNFGGSREISKPFESLKNQRAIVQAYCNSDRCSFTHPELAYWDRVPEELINKIATYYYNNHPHMKYMLYMYALMVRRCDLEFASQEVGLDTKNPCFIEMQKGRAALIKILDQLGLGNNSTPMIAIWKQHLGCQLQSMDTEQEQKFRTFITLNKLQLYQAKKIVKHEILQTDPSSNQRKLRLLQSTLANLTSSAGKG